MQEAVVIKTIQGAAARVFSTMLNKELTCEEPYGEKTKQEGGAGIPAYGVSAQISLIGACSISSLLHCSALTACKIASAMLMAECPAVDDEVLDALAETANMIMGNVKTDLDEHLGAISLSIPTVVFGEGFAVYNKSKRWTVVPFVVEEEAFYVKICFEEPVRARSAPMERA